MYTAIVSLILVSFIFLIGFGKRVLVSFRVGLGRMLMLLLATTAIAVVPPYIGQNYTVNYLGVWLCVVALFYTFRKSSIGHIAKVVIGSVAVAGIAVAYRYFAAGIWDTVYGEVLYPIVILLTAYIVSGGNLRIFINTSLGVAIANLVMGLVPFYGVDIMIGGNGEVMLLGIVAAILLSEIVVSINHALRPRRASSTRYEAAEEFFDADALGREEGKYDNMSKDKEDDKDEPSRFLR